MKHKKPIFLIAAILSALSLCLSGCGKPGKPGDTASSTTNDTEITSGQSRAETTSGQAGTKTDKSDKANSKTQPSKTNAATTKGSVNTTRKPSNSSTSKTTQQNNTSTSASYAPLGRDIMPVGAWVAPPPANILNNNPNYITKENYKLAKDAGINILYSLYERVDINPSYVMQALDAAQANGIKYFVSDANVQAGADDRELMDNALKRYKDHPAFLGNLMLDEPSTSHFDFLGEIHKNYRISLPDKVFYINLLPTYASKNQLFKDKTDGGGGTASIDDYRRYLDEYVEKVKPRFISYDNYPCTGDFPSLQNDYFTNMSLVRQVCLEENIPFWVFIQATSWGSGVRVPTLSEIEWQVNTALSYGAQGIQYFTFWIPMEKGNWSGAMIDANGNKTPVYGYVQKVNRQVAAVDHVLMNSRSKGVIVSGSSPVPVPSGDQLSNYKELKSVSGIPSLTGCFDYNGKSAFYVTNNSITKDGTIILEFTKSVKMSVYQDGVKTSKTGSRLELSVAKGSGFLVVIE